MAKTHRSTAIKASKSQAMKATRDLGITLPAEEIRRHRQSMQFCDRLIKLVGDRIQVAQQLSDEYQRIGELLQIAQNDLRSMLPALLGDIQRLEIETADVVKKAIKAGDADAAAVGARSLATWSREKRATEWQLRV